MDEIKCYDKYGNYLGTFSELFGEEQEEEEAQQ